MGFSVGNFDFVCQRVPLPVCTALGSVDAKCYARNIPLGRLLLFEPGTTFRLMSSCIGRRCFCGRHDGDHDFDNQIKIYFCWEKGNGPVFLFIFGMHINRRTIGIEYHPLFIVCL